MVEIAPNAVRVFLIADAIGATQLISFLQPFQKRISRGEISFALEPHDKDKAGLLERFDEYRPDILVMSRYSVGDASPLVERARALGAPVVFHIDDDLLNVPRNIGEKKFIAYNRPERLATLRSNMDAADLIYVSTLGLAEVMRTYGLKAPIVAGELYCSVDPIGMEPPSPSTVPVIGYMGSEGHSADLALVVPAIASLMDEWPDLRFETYGTINFPPELKRFGRRVGHHSPLNNYAAFLRKLCSLGWWIGLAPLEDTVFNACKADTKWVEYALAGIATVASDGPVYLNACAGGGGLLAGAGEDWRCAIAALLRDADRRRALVAGARRKLVDLYSHDNLENQVLQIFDFARERSAVHKPS